MKTQLCLLASSLALATTALAESAPAPSGVAEGQTTAIGSQCTPDYSRMIIFSKLQTDSLLRAIINRDRPTSPRSIPVPHFAINTPDNAFAMTIGGQINPIVGVDMGNGLYDVDGAGINFVTNSIPVPALPGHHSDFYINALNADIDFEVVGLGGTKNQITGYIKFGTNGISNSLALKKAYISAYGVTVGRKSTLLEDGAAGQPPTIDPEGPSGLVSGTTHEISYQTPRKNGFKAAIGLDIPTYYTSNGRYHGRDYKEWHHQTAEDQLICDPTYYSQNIPDVPLWAEWRHSDNNRVRVSAILRDFIYRDLVSDSRRHLPGWGVMLSGNLNPVKPMILYLQAIYGRGIANYIQDLAGMPLGITPSSKTLGKMTATPMMGLDFGVTWNFSSKLQANAMVSEARVWNVGEYAEAADVNPGNYNNYKFAVYSAANVFYNISSYFQVGLEYVYGHRAIYGGHGASDSRLQTQFMFTF